MVTTYFKASCFKKTSNMKSIFYSSTKPASKFFAQCCLLFCMAVFTLSFFASCTTDENTFDEKDEVLNENLVQRKDSIVSNPPPTVINYTNNDGTPTPVDPPIIPPINSPTPPAVPPKP